MMDIGDFNSDRIISFSDVIPRLILLGKTIHVEFYCSGRYFLVTASGLHWRIQGGGGGGQGTRNARPHLWVQFLSFLCNFEEKFTK